ncbi:hypothetical protein B0T14DRAFT_564357 [Immersiella caudata]|uniref:ATP-grasp domain-containing protein n=1 Tax=Immersiella caudata TaxID=314043 RepID=A0AA39WWJ3_9PEZI|nr:hypothetical protein B0T14DRAFT_564357 [Immersiella caudata]
MEANRVPHLEKEEAMERFEYLTCLPYSSPETTGGSPFWTLYLSISLSNQSNTPSRSILVPPGKHPLTQLLGSIRKDAASSTASICLVLSLSSGYVARSDFLSRRLEGCQLALQVASFTPPISFVQAVPAHSEDELLQADALTNVACRAIGAIHLRDGTAVADFERELRNRLSFSWLLAHPIRPRRVAWVQGREDLPSIRRAFEAAAALGIKLVIMDEGGHWMQGESSPGAHLREAFVEVDITPDRGLTDRIVAAVRAYPEAIDGVITISDVRLAAVARASRELGLPTESPEAYDNAANKGRTRMLEEERRVQEKGGGKESFVLGSAEELVPILERQRGGGQLLTFPRIVKPVVGWSSECVARVENEKELAAAVQRASDRHAASPTPSTAVVVEPYVAGPEVDANLVVLDGEVLFCDISDDFPSEGDRAGAGLWANFEETQNVMPSALPAGEQAGTREHLLRSVTGQGFRTGIFHCEARVRNSRCVYRTSQQDGIIDLVPETAAIDNDGQVDVYLHEINARPPGYLETVAVLLAYGVDYYALRLLTAIGNDEAMRIRALSQPFRHGPQFHLSLLMVHQALAGTMRSQDPVGEFLAGHPDVKANVVDFNSRKRGGDVLVGPGASDLCWVGFMSVVSRESRADLLRRVGDVAKTLTYEIETPDGGVVRARGLA